MDISRTVFRDDHEMFRTTARRFFERECLPRQADWDEAGQVDRETWLKAGREGLLCVTLPDRIRRRRRRFRPRCGAGRGTARLGVSGPSFGMHSDIIAPYIARFGNEEQKRKWLPGACAARSSWPSP